ncbi:calcium-binding EF hand family protein [Artemisia annua]|uniref:Calcium-binding EF hand family protein n=1 Tax=Artemisia annua TaxID=35608 RepID=A0A2U1PWG2_ARTAN|nr:calcium-binding EF hand family protein [Artemisia annua]
MGQILQKLQGKEWREKQIRKISDKVFDYYKNEAGKASLGFEELYIAVLLVFNDLNKRLPGPHFDPPKKEEVRALMKECDMNLDGELNREEFEEFMKRLTADTFVYVTQGLLITLAIAPTVAIATKRTTEGVPGIGKVVQKLPTSVYASLITLAVMMIQKAGE